MARDLLKELGTMRALNFEPTQNSNEGINLEIQLKFPEDAFSKAGDLIGRIQEAAARGGLKVGCPASSFGELFIPFLRQDLETKGWRFVEDGNEPGQITTGTAFKNTPEELQKGMAGRSHQQAKVTDEAVQAALRSGKIGGGNGPNG